MFFGRKYELSVLEDTFKKPGFQMTVIYGRRRVGKSKLITEFIKDKRSSYYVANQSSLEDNTRKWSEQYVEDLLPAMKGVLFNNPDDFFHFIGSNCGEEKTVLALDEIPYIAESDETFLSRLQVAIDTIFAGKNIYLIICGSAISFMEKEILSEKSPIFGRRTNQIYLKPFNYIESALFVPRYTNEEKAIVYAVTGGVAKYLSLFDDNLSLDDNLVNNFFRPSGYLYEEPLNLLMQEFRSLNTYSMVIEVCANGANKMNEIAAKAHISTATLAYVLKGLATVGIIRRINSMTEEKNKKKISYEVSDGLYRFWYSFIPSAKAAIEMNKGDVFYYTNVKEKLHAFMGSAFEEMCRYYTLLNGLDGNLNCLVTNVGRWWGLDHEHKSADIDVVGIDDISKKAVIGECKFRNEILDKEVYESLVNRKGLIDRKYEEVQLLFFSLSGYSKWVKENVDEKEVRLLTLEELYA